MAIFKKDGNDLERKAGKTIVDLVLNIASHRAVANSAVTAEFNQVDANKANLDGGNTFTGGNQTIQGRSINLKSTNLSRGETIESNTWGDSRLNIADGNGNRCAFIQPLQRTTGEVDLRIEKDSNNSGGKILIDGIDIKQINNDLTASNQTAGVSDVPFRFGCTDDGKFGYILNEGGADTVHPFKGVNTETYPSSSTDITANGTYDMGEANNYRYVRVNVPKWVKIASARQSTSINVSSYTGVTFVFVPVESHTIQASSGYQFIYTNGSLSRSGNTLTFTAPNMKFQSSGGWADSYNIKCDIYWLAP